MNEPDSSIDKVHLVSEGAAKIAFHRNKERFILNKHFYQVKFADAPKLKPYGIDVPRRGLTLITKRGYLLLVKSFTDNLAWEVQEQLVDHYFEKRSNDDEPTISAKQLQDIRLEMNNCTRYMAHRTSSLSQTLYRQMKDELGYKQIELLPADSYEDAIQWIKKHQPVCHQVWQMTNFIEREFMDSVKSKQHHNTKNVPMAIMNAFQAKLSA